MKNILKFTVFLLIIIGSLSSCDKLQRLRIDEFAEAIKNMPCDCIMDTLKGEWTWFREYGSYVGNGDNKFKSVIKILSQNADTSIDYEVFAADTLFYKGTFQLQASPVRKGIFVSDMKLPHWQELEIWGIYFHYGSKYNEVTGRFEDKPTKDTVTLWGGGNYYIYKKIK